MALDVMRHRLVLSYEALADDVTADDLLEHHPRPHPGPGGTHSMDHGDVRVSA